MSRDTSPVRHGARHFGRDDERKEPPVSEPAVLINVFEVPAADAEECVAAWEKTRDYLQRDPAHLDTALHQALGSDADFQFVNVAHWRSAEEFTEAASSPGFRKPGVSRSRCGHGLGSEPTARHTDERMPLLP